MVRHVLIIMLFFLTTFFSFAQFPKASIQHTPLKKLDGKLGAVYYKKDSLNQFYTYRIKRHQKEIILIVEKYDKSLNIKKSFQTRLKTNEEKLVSIREIDNRLFMFTYYVNMKKRELKLYSREINQNNFSIVKPPTLLINKSIYRGKQLSWKDSIGYFSTYVSKNRKKLLITYFSPLEKKTNRSFHFYCFNKDLNLKWDKNYKTELPTTSHLMDSFVFHKENLYFTQIHFTKIEGKETSLVIYNSKDNQLKEQYIKSPNKKISDTKIFVDQNDNIICAGIYSNKNNKKEKLDGSFSIQINTNDNSISPLILSPIKILPEIKEKYKNATLGGRRFTISSGLIREDNSLVLLIQRAYLTSKSNSVYHHANQIIIINQNDKGTTTWEKKIIKYQRAYINGKPRDLVSFQAILIDDNICIFYNDDIRNKQKKQRQKLTEFKGKSPVITMVSINKLGLSKKSFIDLPEPGKSYLSTFYNFPLNQNEFIGILREGSKKYALGKITIH